MKHIRDAAKVSSAKKMKCYASGGRVSEDVSDPSSLPVVAGGEPDGDEGPMGVDGSKAKPRMDKASKKPAMNVNVVVMSGKDKAAAPAPIPPMANPMPPPPMPPMGAGGPPPGLPMRKHGGRVMAKGEGAGGGLGRLDKIKDYGAKAGKPAKGK